MSASMKSILIASALFTASGCATLDPYTGERKTSNLAKGAAIGAVSGAAIGAIAGKGKGALIGAAAGASVGGGIGYYMDRQEMLLRQKLEGTGVRVQRNGENITLIMPGNITFATNSANISSNFFSVLNSVALVLQEFRDTRLEIVGFTDSTGKTQHNQLLSDRRAQSVASYLVSQNVGPTRIYARGMGERFPIGSNQTEQGRAANRRVELNIIPSA